MAMLSGNASGGRYPQGAPRTFQGSKYRVSRRIAGAYQNPQNPLAMAGVNPEGGNYGAVMPQMTPMGMMGYQGMPWGSPYRWPQFPSSLFAQ